MALVSGAHRTGSGLCSAKPSHPWRAQPALRCHFEPAGGFFVAGGAAAVVVFAVVVSVGAGGDAGQADELAPTEGGASGPELFLYGLEILFAVQAAVFADRVLEHAIKDGVGRVAGLAVDGDRRRGAALIVVADGVFGFGEQAVGIFGLDPSAMIARGIGIGLERRVRRDVISRDDEAAGRVLRFAETGHIAEGVGGVG